MVADSIAKILKYIICNDPAAETSLFMKNPAEIKDSPGGILQLHQAFLKHLVNRDSRTLEILQNGKETVETKEIAEFYLYALGQLRGEWRRIEKKQPRQRARLVSTANWCHKTKKSADQWQIAEKCWAVFFPEGCRLRKNITKEVDDLRKKRKISILQLNQKPIESPLDEILFTSNILLGLPVKGDESYLKNVSRQMAKTINKVQNEGQLYWYDHPIPIGIEEQKNEALYGLRGLDQMVRFEKKYQGLHKAKKLTCLLSASVTHKGLHDIVRPYLQQEFKKAGSLDNIDLFVFTENDCRRLLNDILLPAALKYIDADGQQIRQLNKIFGVDGEYGRHYSFLKAIAALWAVLIDPQIRATFKIDLDQVFPQENLLAETGQSALEHLQTPLWGAEGFDAQGQPVHLGMIAGALVNQQDIEQSIFTPDVVLPEGEIALDEYIFYSRIPQAISTMAEMQMRYDAKPVDGHTACIQRVHVTGGTNGILIDSLFKYRPFTPSFISRAEDQAYLLSVFGREKDQLAYAHKDGLIMRHDKESFTMEAIEAAATGKLVGDYNRLFLFSAYARLLHVPLMSVKSSFDPFTGCFISQMPATVTYLRFALKGLSLILEGNTEKTIEFIQLAATRLKETSEFCQSRIRQEYLAERAGWDLYYRILKKIQSGLTLNDRFACSLRDKAATIIKDTQINL